MTAPAPTAHDVPTAPAGRPPGRLAGRTALVTGAARGIGRACAVAYARAGADLLLTDIGRDLPGVPYPLGTAEQLAHTALLCREQGAGSVVTVPADVRDTGDVRAVVDAALDRFGRIDVLLNNAGIAAPSGKTVYDITSDEWDLMLDVDVSGAWRMIRAVGGAMTRQRSGSIVNVASTAGLVGYRHFAGYVTAKHALVGLTKAAALDLAPFGVRVNALCPGSVRDDEAVEGRMLSEIARSLDVPVQEHEQTFVAAQPMNRLIEPDDVAGAALWLASDESRQVTGSTVTVDGGFTSR
ncbi:(-)-trans-carveol dehydrogenase [Streptomyces sp. enrichment culture]